MRHFILGAIALIVFCFLSACDTPSESISIPEESGNSFMFSDSSDTLYVWGDVVFDFTTELDPANSLDSIIVYLGGLKLFTTLELNTFRLSTSQYASHEYLLRAIFYSHTRIEGTVVNFVDEISKTLFINNERPEQRVISELGLVDGLLELRWNDYDIFNFQSYTVERSNGSGWTTLAEISDPKKNYWRYPTYVGGGRTFRVNIKAAGFELNGKTRSVSGFSAAMNSVTISDSTYVSWFPNVFDSAFVAYRLEMRSGGSGAFSDVERITDINTTTYTSPSIIFGEVVDYRIIVESVNISRSITSDFISSFAGEQVPSFEKLTYLSQNDRIYLYGSQSASEYVASTMQELGNHFPSPYFSASESDAYKMGSTSSPNDLRNFTKVDVQTLQEIQQYSLDTFIGYESYINRRYFHPVNNNRIWYSGLTYDSPTFFFDKIFFIDVVQGTVVHSYDERFVIYDVSVDGDYLLLASPWTLFHFDGSQMISLRNIGNPSSFTFHPDNEHFILAGNQKVDIYSLSTNAIVNSILVSDGVTGPNIDPATGYLGCYTTSRPGVEAYQIYDLSSGALKEEIPVVVRSASPGVVQYWMADSKLFSIRGYYMPLNLD